MLLVAGYLLLMAAPKGTSWRPTINVLEFLLTGRPQELLDIAVDEQPESDRALYTRIARNWVGNQHLEPAERARIQAVWLDGEYRPALNVTGARRSEIRALVLPYRASSARPDTEELQLALGGET